MDYMDSYAARINALGKTERDRKTKAAVNRISRGFESDPSYVELEGVQPNGDIVQKRLKVVHEDFIKQVSPERYSSIYFMSHPEERICAGTVFFDYQDANWMVANVSNLGEILDRGLLQKASHELKWVFEGELYSSIATMYTIMQRTEGIDEGSTLVVPDDAIRITLPRNDITTNLKRDIRMVIERHVYKVTKVDRYSHPELVYLTVMEDFTGSGDNMEEEIADYDKLISPPTPPDPSEGFQIKIDGLDRIRIGETKEYEAVFYNNVEYTEEVFWEVDSYAVEIVSYTSTKIRLRAKTDISLIGQKFNLVAKLVEDESLTGEMEIRIASLV